jgi:3-dehydroquinate synthase
MKNGLAPVRVPVALADRQYDVLIGAGLLWDVAGLIRPFCPAGRVVIVTDQHVADLYLGPVQTGLAKGQITSEAIVLPPGESTKNFAQLETLVEDLIARNIERGDLILALGGGVIGDITGFAAAIVKRGLDFVQIPTSLLAQVDSSVGGKTAVNSRRGKNLIGAFHQPRLVIADLDVLASLPPREVMAGYAEIVKCALIGDGEFFGHLEQSAQRLIAGDQTALLDAVCRAVGMKAEIVAQDERESGRRALLNLGHTFGHAFEAATGFGSRFLHGEAVALGLCLAFDFSASLELCVPEAAARVKAHLTALGFITDPAQVPGAPYGVDFLMAAMAQDKKVEGGRLTFILARAIGDCFVAKNVDADRVRRFLISTHSSSVTAT